MEHRSARARTCACARKYPLSCRPLTDREGRGVAVDEGVERLEEGNRDVESAGFGLHFETEETKREREGERGVRMGQKEEGLRLTAGGVRKRETR